MPLVLPLLRLLLLFVNVYETFKTLRPPRGGTRTSQPSIRAVSQRKRDMKGCMTVWLLWCCCTIFERNCDPIFGLVVPFYSEFKSLVYMFQLLTRARGAEPIYLHVIRPIIKPYAATLDWTLDSAAMIGDFLALLMWLPVQLVLDWWYPQHEAPQSAAPSETALQISAKVSSGPKSTIPTRVPSGGTGSATVAAHANVASNTVGTRTRRTAANVTRSSGAPGPSVVPTQRPASAMSTTSSTLSNGNANKKYEVWRPPQQLKEASNRPSVGRRNVSDPVSTAQRVTSNPPTPPEPLAEAGRLPASIPADEDWRHYPPFPSAYPTTPYKAAENADSTSEANRPALTSVSEHVVTDGNGVVVAEVEEWRLYPPFPSAYPTTPQKNDATPNGAAAPLLDSVKEPSTSNAPLTRVQIVRPPVGRGHSKASSASQSLPTRRGRGGAGRTQRGSHNDIDSDSTSAGQDFGRPRESFEDEGSDSRGRGSNGRKSKRQRSLRDEEREVVGEDGGDKEIEEGKSEDEMDVGLTDGDETMVASVNSLDDAVLKPPSMSEFGVRKDKSAVSRTTGQIRVASNLTVRGRGGSRGRANWTISAGVGVARRPSQSSLTSRTSRSVSQSTVHSAISATNSLYTPVSREPSANSLQATSSSSSSKSSSMSENVDIQLGTKRPRAQMVRDDRNRLKDAKDVASGSAETLREETEEVEAADPVAVNGNAPQMKKRKVGTASTRQARADMPPPAQVPEGRAKTLS